MKNLTVYNTL